MLAFDIETNGVSIKRNIITVTAVHGFVKETDTVPVSRTFYFQDTSTFEQEREDFLNLLDEAEELCGFNSYHFDIPFIQYHLNVEKERVARWIAKTFDMFHICKKLYNTTFKLDDLLIANGMEVKTSSGAEAVHMYNEGRIQELRDYCLQDSIKTHDVHVKETIITPKLGLMDSRNWTILHTESEMSQYV